MHCEEIQEHLSAYLESDLPGERMDQVRLHLGHCKPCSQVIVQMQTAWASLDQWEGIEPSAQFKQSFWARIDQLPNPRAVQQPRTRPRWLEWTRPVGWNWAPVGTLATVLMVASLWLFWPTMDRTPQNGALLEMVTSMELLERQELLNEMDLFQELDLFLVMEEGDFTHETG